MQPDNSSATAALDRRTVGHLARPVPLLPSSTTCGSLAELFGKNPDQPAYVIERNDGSFDMVDRGTFMARYLYGYNRDLYQRTPVAQFWEQRSLVVSEDERTEDVGIRMTSEHPELLNSGFVITRGGQYAGVGLSIELMRAIALLAQAANTAKDTFLANMNHEIRTPLNAVIGNLELLALTRLDAEQSEFARMAEMSAAMLLELIGDLLDLSKIQAGRVELEKIETDVSRLIDEVLTIVRPGARRKGMRITARIGADVPGSITTDPLRLRQVLVNFIGNAIKFTATGGVFITVNTQKSPGGRFLRFEVVDTGPGFDPARATELFKPFVQEDASTTRRFGGTGLGLAISKGIIEQIGGEIGCSSEPGLGATFWCSVPITSTAAANRAAPPDLDSCTILLLGSGDSHAALAAALRDHGATVSVEEPPPRTPELLSLVIVAAAPDDDEQSLRHLSARDGRKAPIVAAVSFASKAYRYRAHRAGADYVIRVPDEITDLMALAARLASPANAPTIVAAEPAQPFAMGRGKILVIDDTLTNRTLAARQLKQLGFDCDTANNGHEGLEKATANHYSAILVDASMPVMDGNEFVNRWRQFEAARGGTRTPVIAVTAHALAGDAERFKAAGTDDYLPKPVTLAKLQGTLQKWLVNRPRPDETGLGAPAIDLPELAEMLGNQSGSSLVEMLDIFLGDFPTLVADVSDSLRNGARKDLARAAHAAKSAATSACAKQLAQILGAIEGQAAGADVSRLEQMVAEANAEFARVQAELAANRQKLTA